MTVGWQEFVLYLVFAAGTAASLFAFFWGRRLKQTGSAPKALREDPAFSGILGAGLAVAGETEVEAPSPQALLDVLALHLQNPLNFMHYAWARVGRRVGQLHVERLNDNELSFTAEGLSVSEGLVRAEPGVESGKVRVRWALQVPRASFLITVGQAWALFLALPASVLGPVLIFVYVLGSNNPAVRGQFMQVIQVCQVLWEPFLFIGIASQRLRWAGNYLEMLITAAAFQVRTGRPALAVTPLAPPQG